MSSSAQPLPKSSLPDHTQLPDSDGRMKQTFQEHPQAMLLTLSLWPVLQQLHPDGLFIVGADSGIYWREPDPPLRGCLAPDWFYVPDVPPMLQGEVRRSYVMWQELIPPLIVMEFASGDGNEERDRTPEEGKYGGLELSAVVGQRARPLPDCPTGNRVGYLGGNLPGRASSLAALLGCQGATLANGA